LAATVEFAPAGTSIIADETVWGSMKAEILNDVIGFRPLSQPAPIGNGGVRFDKSELLEIGSSRFRLPPGP